MGFRRPGGARRLPATLPRGRAPPRGPRPPDAPAGLPVRWLFYTSGTTADPKGAQHTDRTVMAAAYGMGVALAVDDEDHSSLVFPFTHIGGIVLLMVGLMAGCRHL